MRNGVAALLILLAAFAAAAQAQQRTDVYLFWAIGCPHCEREIDFLSGWRRRSRGSLEKKDVLNARPLAELRRLIAPAVRAAA